MRTADKARRGALIGLLALLLAAAVSPAALGSPSSEPAPPAAGGTRSAGTAPTEPPAAAPPKPHVTAKGLPAPERAPKVKDKGKIKGKGAPALPRPKAQSGPALEDLSNRLPHTARDEIVGDFLGLGYDQHARVENTTLNIYAPPGKGGALLRSTTTDLQLPRVLGTTGVLASYGSEKNENCGGCFADLDIAYHFLTVELAYDGTHIYMAGWQLDARGNPVIVVYMVSGDGSCASGPCVQAVTTLGGTFWGCSANNTTYNRNVAVTSLAVGTSGGTTVLAVGMSDYGVAVYTVGGSDAAGYYMARSDTSGAMAIASDVCTQTPITALAWDPRGSGLLAVGVTTYYYLGYFLQVSSAGRITSTVTWGQIGGLPNGEFGGTPLSAAIGYRPNSTRPVVAFGLTDGSVRLLDPTTSNPTPLASITMDYGVVAIDPVTRLDGSGVTDYAVARQVIGNVAQGDGVFLVDDGTATLTRSVVGVDAGNNPTLNAPGFDTYRAWFPGYKQGRFSLRNDSPYPVTVTLAGSSTPGKGCWFAPSWADGGQEFPVSGVEVEPGQTAGAFTMGAYTAGPLGTCAANPTLHNLAAWRAYLVVRPRVGADDADGGTLAGETRLVDVQLAPVGWTVKVDDQQGGSLPVVATQDAAYPPGKDRAGAFGAYTFGLGSSDAAPVLAGGAPSLVGHQLNPGTRSPSTVYRFDVGSTTWTFPGLGDTPRQVQGLIPPLQVQGLPPAPAATPGQPTKAPQWTDVGLLMPNGKLNVSGNLVTVPGASFYWQNAAGGPQYTAFRVVPQGSGLTPAGVSLSTLGFCYTTGGTDAQPCATPPTLSGVSFVNTSNGALNVMANGLDQALLSLSVSSDASGRLATGDDAYNKVFYREGSSIGPLVTNLYRQDVACDPDCYSAFVGVQPRAGAYLNTGVSTLSATRRSVRGLAANDAGYLSTSSVSTVAVVGVVQLQTGSVNTKALSAQGYPLNLTSSGTALAGFGLAGCLGETAGNSCLIVPTTSTRAALYQAGSNQLGPLVGALFSNQGQDAATDLPLTWPDTAAQLLDKPVVLTTQNTPTYRWNLATDNIETASTDTVVVTHGSATARTLCTKSTPTAPC